MSIKGFYGKTLDHVENETGGCLENAVWESMLVFVFQDGSKFTLEAEESQGGAFMDYTDEQ